MYSTRTRKRKGCENVATASKKLKPIKDEQQPKCKGNSSGSSIACEKSISSAKGGAKTKRPSKASSAAMSAFVRSYKGLDDWHIPIFSETASYTKAKHVLYPGSFCHLTASLFFPSIVYVDADSKMGRFFKDETLKQWVNDNKRYIEKTSYNLLCKNFETETFEKIESFDLMISACAGIVSTPCEKYLRKGGYLLVSDAHSDARQAYISGKFDLVAAFEDGAMLTDSCDLDRCFMTTKGATITPDQVKESIAKPRSKRSFKLEKELMFYLFQKKTVIG